MHQLNEKASDDLLNESNTGDFNGDTTTNGSSSTTDNGSNNNESNLLNKLYDELMDCVSTARGLDGAVSLGFIEATINNLAILWGEFRNAYLSERAPERKFSSAIHVFWKSQ